LLFLFSGFLGTLSIISSAQGKQTGCVKTKLLLVPLLVYLRAHHYPELKRNRAQFEKQNFELILGITNYVKNDFLQLRCLL